MPGNIPPQGTNGWGDDSASEGLRFHSTNKFDNNDQAGNKDFPNATNHAFGANWSGDTGVTGSGPNGSITGGDARAAANQAGKGVTDIWNGINGHYNAAGSQIDPMTGQVNPNGQQMGQTRDMQAGLIQQLQDQAAGKGPSLAQMQLQKATDANLSNAMALGASQRGAGAAGMMKGIQTQQSGISQGMANDSAMLRLHEQMQARDQLGQQAGQMRSQDQFMANANAQRMAETAKANAQLDLERQKMQQQNAKDSSPMGFIGGLFSAMSDERLKEEISPGEGKLYAFLDKLGSHDYKYKDEKHGVGRRISPMAQELEKSELGKQFVFGTRDGKAVDYGKGLGTILASQAALHKRLKKIEGK